MWNYDVFNEVYSQKLCLSGLKGVSGYDSREGHYQSDWIDLPIATDDVLNMLWPNLTKLLQASKAAKKQTAWNFLHCLLELRRSLFQDVAYIILTGDNHWLLNEEPFNTEEFGDYVQICKKHIEKKILTNKQVVVKK